MSHTTPDCPADAPPPRADDCPARPPRPAAARPTLGEIFRRYGPAYLAKHGERLSRDQRRVLEHLARCRTGALGGVRYECPACRQRHTAPRSCGDRHCPECQGAKARAWLAAQVERVLPCAYFLVTFTLPSELRPLARAQPREAYGALFDAAVGALREAARNPRFVGADGLGLTAILHTWGRTLAYHPHVHCVVPGGALSADGTEWLASRVDFLAPVHVLSELFRGKFRDRLRELGLDDRVPPEVWTKPWVVHCAAVGDGRHALRYLAPYVYRVALSPRRVLRCEPGPDGLGRVTFSYRKSGGRCYRPMTVTAEEFIRRFLQHVLPRGFQKVRHYGFAHPRRQVDHERLAMLVTVTLQLVYELRVALRPPRPAPPRPACPTCGGPLVCRGFVRWPTLVDSTFDTS